MRIGVANLKDAIYYGFACGMKVWGEFAVRDWGISVRYYAFLKVCSWKILKKVLDENLKKGSFAIHPSHQTLGPDYAGHSRPRLSSQVALRSCCTLYDEYWVGYGDPPSADDPK